MVTPPYSTPAVTETVEYRFASSTSTSAPISVVYENQRAYTGMAATIYGYAAPYCPATAVQIADLGGREAGGYGPGALLIRVDSRVGATVNLSPSSQRTLALHECSHELQWLRYGSTQEGYSQMKAAAAGYFAEGSNGAEPIEHAGTAAHWRSSRTATSDTAATARRRSWPRAEAAERAAVLTARSGCRDASGSLPVRTAQDARRDP